ncbi:J domain-containing protein [Flavobacteriales bacterium]|nr:J domain-containing protein [Flavobacteriales bacterium]
MENYYKILGLKLGATLDEVEKKYSELLKEFDPKEQSDNDLKEFFKSEQDKVKEAYKEISESLIDKKDIEQVVDEINSEKNALQSTTEKKKSKSKKSVKKKSKKVEKEVVDEDSFTDDTDKDTTTNEEDISDISKIEAVWLNKLINKKEHKYSISSEIEFKLTRAYLIMFILGLPLAVIIAGGGRDLQELIEVYFEIPLLALMFHFIGAILVLLLHMFLIIKSSGFLSIRENLSGYFIERKKYFIRILAFTPLVLVSLYGWGGMIMNSENKDYWYSYQAIKSEVSGDDYDSGCDKEIRLKLHNHTYQTLRFYVSWKEKNGEWTKWGYWDVNSKEYKRYGLNNWDSEPLYTSDYRYYITTTDDKKYMHSRAVPHITNTCNAKCINIY